MSGNAGAHRHVGQSDGTKYGPVDWLRADTDSVIGFHLAKFVVTGAEWPHISKPDRSETNTEKRIGWV